MGFKKEKELMVITLKTEEMVMELDLAAQRSSGFFLHLSALPYSAPDFILRKTS